MYKFIYIYISVKHCLFTITCLQFSIISGATTFGQIRERPVANVDQLLQKWPNSVPHLPQVAKHRDVWHVRVWLNLIAPGEIFECCTWLHTKKTSEWLTVIQQEVPKTNNILCWIWLLCLLNLWPTLGWMSAKVLEGRQAVNCWT